METDWDWEQFGESDPYWAVITLDKYRVNQMSDAALDEFYESGEYQINWILETIRKHVDPEFAPASALDFGCGVGRLTLALAGRCAAVTGVDVSAGMLREARRNCDRRGLTNVSLIKGDDDLSQVTGKFDLVATFIVLQHIPAKGGEQLFRRLVALVSDGGVGAIHVTYARRDGGPEAAREEGEAREAAARAQEMARETGDPVPSAAQPTPRDPAAAPTMQMNGYDVSRLLYFLQQAGIRRFHAEFTDHGGTFGVMFFFRKLPDEPYAA